MWCDRFRVYVCGMFVCWYLGRRRTPSDDLVSVLCRRSIKTTVLASLLRARHRGLLRGLAQALTVRDASSSRRLHWWRRKMGAADGALAASVSDPMEVI